MKKLTSAICAAGALVFATPAIAQVVTVTDQTTGTPLTDTIHESTTNTDEDVTQVYGSTAQGGGNQNVTFTGGNALQTTLTSATQSGNTIHDNLHITEGGGFAFVGPTDGETDLYSIIINPDQYFTDMKFALQLTGAGSFDVYYLLAGATTFVDAGTTFLTDNKGNTNYLVDVTGGVFDAIEIDASNTGGSIFELKQISINNVAVPEPASWALMLLGFCGIGWAVKRRRKVGTIPQLA